MFHPLTPHFNIFIVFTVSGLWHGASWHFVVWGIIHAIYQIAGDIKSEVKRKVGRCELQQVSFSQRLSKIIVTFILADLAWVVFAADSLSHAHQIFRQMFTAFQLAGIYEIGLDRGNWFILKFGIMILMAVDIIHEKGKSVFQFVNRQTIWFRWILYLGLVWSIILFGIYGVGYDAGQFIYFQF